MEDEIPHLVQPLCEAIHHFYEPKTLSTLAKTKVKRKLAVNQKETFHLHIVRKGGYQNNSMNIQTGDQFADFEDMVIQFFDGLFELNQNMGG
jgi:hypothetical protein